MFIRLIFGRFIPEILRTVQALQVADCTKGATAANWRPYEPVIVPVPKTYDALKSRVEEINQNRNGISWYLSFKPVDQKCMLNNNEDNNNESQNVTNKKCDLNG